VRFIIRRRRAVTWAAAVQVLVLGLTALAGAAPAAAAPVTPGAVLSAVPAVLPQELASLATGKRISYATTAIDGTSITATGLILTPTAQKANRTVVWGHGTTGLADRCAPSTNQEVFWPEARVAVAALLRKGWTVAAPDYPGLGTPAPHPYLIGASEARSMIDSVRAARNLDANLSVHYALDGHSQGGQGVLFAGELAPSYDGPLMLRGVASIAPVSNAGIFAPMVPGTPGQGYLVMGLYGLSAVDPSFNPDTVLGVPAQQRATVLQTGCLYQILDAYAPLTAGQLLVGGTLPDAVIAKLAHYVDPAQAPSSAPILLVQGTADESVPYDLTAGALLPELQQYAQPVTFVPIDGANHDEAVIRSADMVASWIATRFG
jgi:fermentation-respiration switch protein FrsA (DUF1100 family)